MLYWCINAPYGRLGLAISTRPIQLENAALLHPRRHICKQLATLVLLCSSNVSVASGFDSKVIAVLDGDTILIQQAGKPRKVRLLNVDAPELAQPAGLQAKQVLSQWLLNKTVRINSQASDSYGRLLAEVYLGKQQINTLLVQQGWAWEYSHFHSNKTFIALQQQAQQHKRGLWAKPGAQAPWLWRKQHHAPPADPRCREKRYCNQMTSCQQAQFYHQLCRPSSLDSDGDGVPCEALCRAK